MSVLEFKPRPAPHTAGSAFCMACNHEWAAVAPVGTQALECPACRAHRGQWKFDYSPAPDTLVRTCACGNQLFHLTHEGYFCPRCGDYSGFDYD